MVLCPLCYLLIIKLISTNLIDRYALRHDGPPCGLILNISGILVFKGDRNLITTVGKGTPVPVVYALRAASKDGLGVQHVFHTHSTT